MIEPSRRGFITGLIAFAATAPAIVRAANIMPVKSVDFDFWEFGPYMQVYGRSPAMDALPSLRELSRATSLWLVQWNGEIALGDLSPPDGGWGTPR